MDKKTLLQITQDILNDISGDEVNSINDTVESVQCAAIVQSTYFDMMTSRDWTHTKKLIQPLADATLSLPTHVQFDDSMKRLVSVYYDCSKTVGKLDYKEVKYLSPDDFLRFTNQRNTLDSNTLNVTDPSGITLLILNNYGPKYYTSFDDKQVVFDSYDSSMDTFLKQNKFQAYGYIIPDWSQEDDFIPPIPIEVFPLLINEAKSRASVKLRQQPDQKAEQQSQKQNRFMARNGWNISPDKKFPNYGRNPRHLASRYNSDPTFRRDN